MSNTDTGGPAFPQQDDASGSEGMTLRDYFAAKAMQAMLSSPHCPRGIKGYTLAEQAYQAADAMLKARGQ
jgi:hypothetical protein